ncbi:hypothetical protein Tco_0100504 [Tanacetum coccineum]
MQQQGTRCQKYVNCESVANALKYDQESRSRKVAAPVRLSTRSSTLASSLSVPVTKATSAKIKELLEPYQKDCECGALRIKLTANFLQNHGNKPSFLERMVTNSIRQNKKADTCSQLPN